MTTPAEPTTTATRTFRVAHTHGFHARPATGFVRTASRFQCDIRVQKDGAIADGKSLISLLMLAAGCGSQLVVDAHGPDASQAMAALAMLFEAGLGECES